MKISTASNLDVQKRFHVLFSLFLFFLSILPIFCISIHKYIRFWLESLKVWLLATFLSTWFLNTQNRGKITERKRERERTEQPTKQPKGIKDLSSTSLYPVTRPLLSHSSRVSLTLPSPFRLLTVSRLYRTSELFISSLKQVTANVYFGGEAGTRLDLTFLA